MKIMLNSRSLLIIFRESIFIFLFLFSKIFAEFFLIFVVFNQLCLKIVNHLLSLHDCILSHLFKTFHPREFFIHSDLHLFQWFSNFIETLRRRNSGSKLLSSWITWFYSLRALWSYEVLTTNSCPELRFTNFFHAIVSMT
jgi:hypothetical protein